MANTLTAAPESSQLPDMDWTLHVTFTDSPVPVPADCGSGDGCGSTCASACAS